MRSVVSSVSHVSVAIVNKSLRSSTFTLTHAFDILTPQQLIKSSTRTKQRPHPIPSRRSPPNSVTDGQDRINGQGFLIGPRNKLLRGRQPFSKPEGPGCYFYINRRPRPRKRNANYFFSLSSFILSASGLLRPLLRLHTFCHLRFTIPWATTTDALLRPSGRGSLDSRRTTSPDRLGGELVAWVMPFFVGRAAVW